jgi:hypothetical protein
VLSASSRKAGYVPSGTITEAKSATKSSIKKSAGSNRRARRAQNAPSRIVRVARHSETSSEVMRKPDKTKNVSTPMKPPVATARPPWNIMTATTAKARTPSRPGM